MSKKNKKKENNSKNDDIITGEIDLSNINKMFNDCIEDIPELDENNLGIADLVNMATDISKDKDKDKK